MSSAIKTTPLFVSSPADATYRAQGTLLHSRAQSQVNYTEPRHVGWQNQQSTPPFGAPQQKPCHAQPSTVLPPHHNHDTRATQLTNQDSIPQPKFHPLPGGHYQISQPLVHREAFAAPPAAHHHSQLWHQQQRHRPRPPRHCGNYTATPRAPQVRKI